MRYDYLISQMTWSYSRITAFENRPYLWLMKYLLGVKSRPKFFSEYGKLMHTILEEIISGSLEPEHAVTRFISGYYAEGVAELAPSQKLADGYSAQGRNYLRTLRLPQRETIGVELRLDFTFADYPFVGFVDWLSRDSDGKIFITDHKSRDLKPRTSRKKPTKSDRELDDYLRQLYIYSAGVHQLYGFYPDYLEFNCFRTNTWITEPFSLKRLQEVERWAADAIHTIEKTERWSPALDFWFCKQLCDTGEECEYFEFV